MAFHDVEKLSKLVLSIDNPAGPTKYKIASEADVTVFFYEAHMVKATHAFRSSSELNDATLSRIGSLERLRMLSLSNCSRSIQADDMNHFLRLNCWSSFRATVRDGDHPSPAIWVFVKG